LASGIALVIGGASLSRLSPTIDEYGYIHYGIRFWFGRDSEGLIRLGTMPVLLWIQNAPGALYFWLKYGYVPGGMRAEFSWTLTLADQFVVLHLARWTNLLLTGPSTVFLVWLLTRRLFGRVAAHASALFCSLEPNLLAGYILGTADAGIVPLCLLLLYLYDDHLRQPRWWKLLAATGTYGLGMAFKISMLPIGLLMLWACVLARVFQQVSEAGPLDVKLRQVIRALLHFGLHVPLLLALALVASWAATGFLQGPLLEPDSPNQVAYRIAGKLGYRGASATAWVKTLQQTRVPAPISVLRHQMAHSRGGHPMIFRGIAGSSGPFYYYPYIFTMKTNIILIILFLLSLFRKSVWRSPVLLAAIHILGLSCTSKIHAGPRYYLTLYALMASLGGVGMDRLLGLVIGWRSKVALVTVLAAMTLALTVRSSPELLTHTSPLWGGDAEGYRYADANYDWGQGLFQAFAAADRMGLKSVAFDHFGYPCYGVPPHRTMIRGKDPWSKAEQMEGRIVVVSVHWLYHSEAEAPEMVPLYRSLREIGYDGRLTDTTFYFDFRDLGRFSRFIKVLERNSPSG
jgi:4-amino-4-deoxy-L-arabinose transferase-like glycosyltransferase